MDQAAPQGAREAGAGTPGLDEQAARIGRDYPVSVSAKFGYLCARLPDDPCAHWDADDEDRMRARLDAARVPRRGDAPSGQGARP